MKIRAAVLQHMGLPAPYCHSRPVTIEQLELADPQPTELRVRMVSAGLCHSDLSIVNGTRPRPTPIALGHEGCGIVEQLGAEVTDLKVGDLVALVFVPSCGACGPCMDARPALCEPGLQANTQGQMLGGGRRLYGIHPPLADKTIHHQVGVSCFATHAVVSRHSCVRISPERREAMHNDVLAALFGCAVITGVGAVVNTAQIKAGSSVAVVGLGGVGMCAVLGALASGAREVIAIDVHQSKLDKALSLGATAAYHAADADLVPRVVEATSGGVDYGFEFAGVLPAMENAYNLTKRGGLTVTASLMAPHVNWGLQHVSLVTQERTLKGSYLGSCVPARDLPYYMDLYLQGKLPVDKLLGNRYALEQINEGLDALATGETMRDVIVF